MQKPIPTRDDPLAHWARVVFILVVSAVLLALSACSGKDAYREMVLIDEESGCQYIGFAHDGLFSGSMLKPRIGRDGKQVCK